MRWLLVILLFCFSPETQEKQLSVPQHTEDTLRKPSVNVDTQYSQVMDVFRKVEDGIRTNLMNEYEDKLGAMVSISIGSGERGYYSMNQAVSVLAGYFSERRPVSFSFSRIHEKGKVPYATGRFVYVQKGIQESAQVYISLTRQNSWWVINQFNIY